MKLVPIIASLTVPLFLYFFLPWIAKKYGKHADRQVAILLAVCVVYGVAWYLPSPIIDGLDTGFWTHFTGGIATGLIWLYMVKTQVLRQKSWAWQAVVLYAIVSSLGVLNELAEFVLVKLALFPISLADTSYDLVANTLGAAAFFVVYKIIEVTRK